MSELNEVIGSKPEPRKYVVGIDIDGVISNFYADMRPVAAEWLGKSVEELTAEPDFMMSQWQVVEASGGYAALHKFAVEQRKLFINATPMPGAAQALRNLTEKGIYIRLITSRICIKGSHAEIIKQTADWLEKYGIPYWDLCFVKDKLGVNADLYIEDSPVNIEKLRRFGRRVLAFKTSTNLMLSGEGAETWTEMEQLILKARNEYGKI